MLQSSRSIPRLCALGLGSFCYIAVHALGLGSPLYLPVTGEWRWSAPPGAIAMGYYGGLLWGGVGWGLGWISGYFFEGRLARRPRLLSYGALSMLLCAMAYFVIVELGP